MGVVGLGGVGRGRVPNADTAQVDARMGGILTTVASMGCEVGVSR